MDKAEMCPKCDRLMIWNKHEDNLTASCTNEKCQNEIKYTFEEKVKKYYFTHKQEEVLEIINIGENYKIVKVKCADDIIRYFSYNNNKRVFYDYGVNSLDEALIALIANNNDTGEYLGSVYKLLDVKLSEINRCTSRYSRYR